LERLGQALVRIDADPELVLTIDGLEPRFQPQRGEEDRVASGRLPQGRLRAGELAERLPQPRATGVERLHRLFELGQPSFGAALAAFYRFPSQEQRVVRLLTLGAPARQLLAGVVEARHQLSFGSISVACTAISTGTW